MGREEPAVGLRLRISGVNSADASIAIIEGGSRGLRVMGHVLKNAISHDTCIAEGVPIFGNAPKSAEVHSAMRFLTIFTC